MYKDIFTYPTANQQVIAVLFGTVQWDKTTPSTKNSPQIRQLWNDIKDLWAAKHKNTIFENTPIPQKWSTEYVDKHMQEMLINTNNSTIDTLLTYDNTRDKQNHRSKVQNPTDDPTTLPYPCHNCDKAYMTKHALSVHAASAHQIRNPLRAQVTEAKCPGCEKLFTNKINAQRHWANQVCIRNNTARYTSEQVSNMTNPTPEQPKPATPQGQNIADLIRLLFNSRSGNQQTPVQTQP
jgi:hypothetical protein